MERPIAAIQITSNGQTGCRFALFKNAFKCIPSLDRARVRVCVYMCVIFFSFSRSRRIKGIFLVFRQNGHFSGTYQCVKLTLCYRSANWVASKKFSSFCHLVGLIFLFFFLFLTRVMETFVNYETDLYRWTFVAIKYVLFEKDFIDHPSRLEQSLARWSSNLVSCSIRWD